MIETPALGNDTATPAAPNFFTATPTPVADAFYSAQHNKWYLTSERDIGGESGLVIVTPGATAQTATVNFASRSFSFANGLDGNNNATTGAGFQDILRRAGVTKLSADGTKLYVHRSQVHADNPYLGQTSNLSGAVLEIPLDANGLPIVMVDQMGTPTDTTDDRITNWKSITIASNNLLHAPGEMDFDAAGNLYTISNNSERLEVFSPGGNKRAITRSNGTFTLQTIVGLTGDYNGDGSVGAADYTLYRDTLGATVTPGSGADGSGNGTIDVADYNLWVANFGLGGPAGARRRSGSRYFDDRSGGPDRVRLGSPPVAWVPRPEQAPANRVSEFTQPSRAVFGKPHGAPI